MQVTREDLNSCTVRLNVVCSAEQVTDAFNRAIKAIAKEVRIPGFRPGHAPKQMVEKMINEQELYSQAADILIQRTFKTAMEQEKIQPDTGVRPSVEIQDLDRAGQKGAYSAKVPLPPKIELSEYKGLLATHPPTEVTDEEVEFQINELRKKQGSREAITDRTAQEGDYCVVNLKLDGDKGEGKNFMVVLGQTFPSLDAALAGMSAEEMKHLELDFPANFSEKTWAGKKSPAQVTLSSISAITLPELNEEFAKSVKTESVEELKVRMRDSIVNAKANMVRDMLQDQLLESLRQSSKVEVSDNMWEALANQRLGEIQDQQQQQGKTLEQYAQDNGMNMDEFVKAWHDQAKVHVERAMVVREIFAKEKLQITNEELNNELFFMSQEFQVDAMELLEYMRKNDSLQELHFRSISRKVSNFLIEHAVVTEGDAPAKPAKVAKAKKDDAPAAEEKPKKAPAKKKAE
ncbi:MAG: trigger factor [Armatimonadota bacterium]